MKKMFLILVITIIIALSILFTILYNHFKSADHSQYDAKTLDLMAPLSSQSDAHKQIVKAILDDRKNQPQLNQMDFIKLNRKKMDERGEAFETDATFSPISVNRVNNSKLTGEWVTTDNSDPNIRLLYIHGGAYMVGSAKSHRPITSKLARALGASILVINHRLLPENSRKDGLDDVKIAYQYMFKNGLIESTEASKTFIAADSSGGNMALSLLAWARDTAQSQVNAAIIMSPQTDLTLNSPSLIKNINTDFIQGESFGPIVKAPKFFRLLFAYWMHRENPSNPIYSPLLGDLSNLPPTLIQVSNSEMFLDDAVRYANKAKQQNSNVVLQIWPNMLHVWQAFDVPEADQAFNEMSNFIKQLP